MEGYKISHLINVFAVPYSFLLPLFTDGESLYFQKICNHKIERFEPTVLESFATSGQIELNSVGNRFKCGDEAVYAIQIGDKAPFVGDACTLRCYYRIINSDIPSECALSSNMMHFMEKTDDLQLSPQFSAAFSRLFPQISREKEPAPIAVFSDIVSNREIQIAEEKKPNPLPGKAEFKNVERILKMKKRQMARRHAWRDSRVTTAAHPALKSAKRSHLMQDQKDIIAVRPKKSKAKS